MTASHAFCEASLMFPHIRPDRWKIPCGKFDHFCFWAVFAKSNWTVPFSPAFNVPRNALAAATTFGTVAATAAVVDGATTDVGDDVGVAVVFGAADVVVVAALSDPELHAVRTSDSTQATTGIRV